MTPPPLAELVAPARTLAVVGLAKNAGKTTVVNHLLDRLAGPVGLVSVGLDGERTDALTGLPKPRVRPPAGALVATAAGLLGDGGGTAIAALPFRTAVGPVVVVRADGGTLVVSGPTRLDELDPVADALRAAGAERIVVDGALGRLGAAAAADAVVVAAGVSVADDPARAPADLRLALAALALPVREGPADVTAADGAGHEADVAAALAAGGVRLADVPGALTGALLERLLRRRVRVALRVADATRVVASPLALARARRAGVDVVAARALPIVAVTASPFHPAGDVPPEAAFAAAREAAGGRWPVYDVVSGWAA